MSDILSLSPIAAAIVGGIIGFAGAMLASRRTTEVAMEHARVSRLRERQYEVFATLYGQANVVWEFARTVLTNAMLDEELRKAHYDLRDATLELGRQLLKNDLWLPNDISAAAAKFASEVTDQQHKFVYKSRRIIQIDDPEYQQKREDFEKWMDTEGNALEQRLKSLMSDYLDLDELKRRPDKGTSA